MITLGVKDLEASINFYQNGLGFPKLESPTDVAFFKLNGRWLTLYNLDDLAQDAGVSSDENGFSGISSLHNVKSEQELNNIMVLVEKAGGKVVKIPQKAEWGGFHGYFEDLDGYLWEVAYNPSMWVGPED
jgi:catechol 2,3-dioxygenase-like lactoylglutathione lyase family enzyme